MKLAAILILSVLLTIPATATTINVNWNGTGDHTTIQAGINAATSGVGDIVIVAPGTYTGAGNRNIDFLGKAITVRSTDPDDPNVVAATIIDCEDTEGSRGFYIHSGEQANSILSGLTVTNGNASLEGGGIYCRYSSPTITDCRIMYNHAEYKGGGIFCRDGNATIRRCQVIGNTIYEDYNSTGKGAGIMVWGCSPVIENCIIANNSTTGRFGHGGGIHGRDGANPTIRNCLIFGNYAANFGGGINKGWNASCVVENCTIANNIASAGGGIGAGSSDGEDVTVINSIVWNNGGTEISGSFIEISYSNIEGGFSGIRNVDADPLFVDPDGADDIVGTEDDDLHLTSWSPCINAGDPAGDYTDQTDMDGQLRSGCGLVDIGADEVFDVFGDVDDDCDVELADFAALGGHWLTALCDEANSYCDGADINRVGGVDVGDLVIIAENWLTGVIEATLPVPNPATYLSLPVAVSHKEITMTATTGTDASNPVEYYFDETSGTPGGTDSGWVTNPVYNDVGLIASTQYTYTVQIRDAMLNTGTVSSPASATTDPLPYPILIAHWKLDESVSGTAPDSSGNEYHGTLYGGCTWQSSGGHIDGALQFDGNQDYVDVPDFDLSGSWTVALWVKCNLQAPGEPTGAMVFGNRNDDDNFFYIADGLRARFENSAGVNVSWTADTAFYNAWRHVGLVSNGTAVELYLDGVSQGSQTITPTIKFYHIGDGWTNSLYDFNGLLDDVRIYDYALDSSEIATLASQ